MMSMFLKIYLSLMKLHIRLHVVDVVVHVSETK